MVGKFRTKVEHTVSLMQSIFCQISTSGHPIGRHLGRPATERNIRVGLNELREEVWRTSVEVPDGKLEKALAFKVGGHRVFNWLDLEIPEVSKQYRTGKSVEIWEVFLVLKFFLNSNIKFNCKREFEQMASDQLPEDIQVDLESGTSYETFDQQWEEVLAAVAGDLGPYSALVKILCGGQLEQRCSGCGDAVTVTSALLCTDDHEDTPDHELFKRRQLHMERVIGKAFVFFGLTTVFCCRKPDCQSSVCGAAAMTRDQHLMAAYLGLQARCSGNRCDGCFQLCNLAGLNQVHRCLGCLTKAYCGAACRDADWRVHKKFCPAEAPERKRKAGKSGRKEQGAKALALAELVLQDEELVQALHE
jgi:hypothetical protein